MSGRTELLAILYSTEWAEQSVELGRHLPFGREMLDMPKSVRSYMMTRSVVRSCMCMADMPMDGRRSDQDPPVPLAAWHIDVWRRMREKKGNENFICFYLWMF